MMDQDYDDDEFIVDFFCRQDNFDAINKYQRQYEIDNFTESEV